MDGNDEEQWLLSRLESAGLALELRTARALRQQGLIVEEPFFYRDVKTKQRREGDILVTPRRGPFDHDDDVRVLGVFECKHSDSGKPWVGVYPTTQRAAPASEPAHWLSWFSDNEAGAKRAAGISISRGLWDEAGRRCTRLLTIDSGTSNHAVNAARQALSEAHGVGEQRLSHNSDGPAAAGVCGVVAAVVTTAKLWTCQLGRDAKIEAEHVDHFEATSEGPDGYIWPVMIMNESYVPTFAGRLRGDWD